MLIVPGSVGRIGQQGTVKSVPAPIVSREIFTILGDSLAAGRGNLDSERTVDEPVPTNARVYVQNSGRPDYQQLTDVAGPLWFRENAGPGRVSPMEKLLIDYNTLTGKPTGLIPAAFGGSSLAVGWNPQTPGPDLIVARDAHNAAMALYKAEDPNCRCAGVAILLTSNAVATQPERELLWPLLIDYVRANFNFVDNTTPIILSSSAADGASGTSNQRRLDCEFAASKRILCGVVQPFFPTANPDNLHPTRAENITYGADFAALFHAMNQGSMYIPAITSNANQGVILGQAANINIVHEGLSYPSRYGAVEITGGPDAALFDVGGTFDAPSIVEVAPGTLTERLHEMQIQIRDSIWTYGPIFNLDIDVTAPVAAGIAFNQNFSIMNQAVPNWGEYDVGSVPITTGQNLLIAYHDYAPRRTGYTISVDSNLADFVAATVAEQPIELWNWNSAIDTTGNVFIDWSSQRGDISFVNLGMTGLNPVPVSTSYVDRFFNNTPANNDTWDVGSAVVPAGGRTVLVVAGGFPNAEPTANSAGLTRVSLARDAGGDTIAVFVREADGPMVINTGTTARPAALILNLAPAS
ncbi:MAG: hypothetical protein ABJP02_04915 [Parasphingorhabdus sp.]|uniref:hypothetical protein n=1 Tax=Parasphingorhabdus sp. TaxID=2709688 RepID=UPI003299DE46